MRTITTTIDLAAPPERVWSVLVDFARYPEWNAFIRSIAGQLVVGAKLDAFIAPPGQRGMRFRPRLLVVDPMRELRWKGRLIVPGLFDGEHFFRLEPNTGGTRLIHGEIFSGLLPALMSPASFNPIEAGFQAMNEALARRALG